MNEKKKKQTGKYLSLILRHQPEKINLSLDNSGWASVSELLEKLSITRHKISIEQLEEIVQTNDKKRYSFNADKTKIRASQGHSISIDLQLEAKQPPNILFHGTATRFLDSILAEGLKAGSRQHVHLSTNIDTATNVGQRYGKPVILEVDAALMYQQGYAFFLSDNDVWLTQHVPEKYITSLARES